jgi:hypothetical protein
LAKIERTNMTGFPRLNMEGSVDYSLTIVNIRQ